MIVYLHMHKCAGTSVVRSALSSGLRLPAMHQNGNLVDDAQKPLKYRGMEREALIGLLQRQRDDGVEFVAMEWDFPRFDLFGAMPGLRFFTSLREPVARAISNFKMDKAAGWIVPDMRFADYINGDALYRSDNYYTKILGQLWPKDIATPADLDRAVNVLAAFEAVIVVEQGNMAHVLRKFGITLEPQRANRFDAEQARARLGDDRSLAVDRQEIGDFIARNALDFALYRHFTRAIRVADDRQVRDRVYA